MFRNEGRMAMVFNIESKGECAEGVDLHGICDILYQQIQF